MLQKIDEAKRFIQTKLTSTPRIGLVLGSGLGVLGDEVENAVKVPFGEIPNFPVSTVSGHAGQLVIGQLAGQEVIVMQGRFHFYEGWSLEEVTFPIRVMKALGVETVFVTNAAGGIDTSWSAGDLMLIEDHINLTGRNPLVGPNEADLGPRFPDMSNGYNRELRGMAKGVAERLGISLREGVYVGVSGPSYETPAEIRMFRILGGHAVGMSTVPEVIVANHCGLKVIGITCISNMAAGILDQPLSHEEVMETTEMAKANFINLVKEIVKEL
ncbi:MAG: purine-nucleoside phosphorylase [Tumebacillaceae bacterium]